MLGNIGFDLLSSNFTVLLAVKISSIFFIISFESNFIPVLSPLFFSETAYLRYSDCLTRVLFESNFVRTDPQIKRPGRTY